MTDLLLIAAGVALLYVGGELLVRGATALARSLGMTPLVVGLTVVAFGTSSPELAATLAATLKGSPEVAVGNVLGSNVANLGLILGASALVFPMAARARFIRREVPFMIAVSALMLPMSLDGAFGRVDAVVLLAGLTLYVAVLLRDKEPPEVVAEFGEEFGEEVRHRPAPRWRSVLKVAGGIALLVAGAHVLVEGAVNLARGFGVPETVIGITLVAVGTSLPELASCLVAALRHEGDIVLGNLIGSNVFNVLAILGVTGMVRPVEVPFATIETDFWVMMAFSVLIVPFLLTGRRVGRGEGAVLLAAYGAYMAWLFW